MNPEAPVQADAGTLGPHGTTDVRKYSLLLIQLAALLGVFKIYYLETPAFTVLSGLCFAGFAVHYWLPFRWKRPFYVLLSMGGAFAILTPATAALLLASGLLLFALLRAPLSYRVRLSAVVVIGIVLLAGRGRGLPGLIPDQFWPVFGAIFMFRMMVYVYDLKHAAGPPGLLDYLSYFFILPNYYFLLFPVVDYQTMCRSYYATDIHDTAQTGVRWMVRGTTHLLLYRVVHAFRLAPDPESVTSLAELLQYMFLTYMLYLRVSGHFHIAVGMLHLFGFNLPETHRRYLLASSITDFWRRINIYWKDFIVKLVYFPVFFRLRGRGVLLATCVATAAAFTLTWALHSYQWYWLTGSLLLSMPDALFWAILGGLVLVSILYETQFARKRARAQPERAVCVGRALRVAVTLLTVMVMWSLWSAPSLGAWLDLLTYWRHG
jgi:D-alanyl-lipoteichoic acid acyltransferase DltB (MBOAT superfamily)